MADPTGTNIASGRWRRVALASAMGVGALVAWGLFGLEVTTARISEPLSPAVATPRLVGVAPYSQAIKNFGVELEYAAKPLVAAGARDDAPQPPDVVLAEIINHVLAHRLDKALELTDRLIEQEPNFRLAYLIRGDLLLARSKPLRRLGDVGGQAEPERVRELREEAMVRLQGYLRKPAAHVVPRYLLQLRPDQKTAVVVDTRRSRLYVYENVAGRPRFLADYYITQGKFGTSKAREGDQKTPIGVYHITSNLPKARLPDFYGAGAMPINYPNEWDQLNGRTGHGIWLHGTPSDTFSRPPRASDGCVVLSNRDFQDLFKKVQIGVTPVIISEDVEWLSLDDWDAERRTLHATLEVWRNDWEKLDQERYLSHYSTAFTSSEGKLSEWSERKRQVNATKTWIKVAVRNVSMLRYPGQDNMVVVTFEQDYRSDNLNNVVRKRQYWRLEDKQWKIVYEGRA